MLENRGRGHLYNKFSNTHFGFMKKVRFDVVQMFTPPKSKSPWEAMTSGSTGGWAGFAGPSNPTNPQDPKGWGWVGPALTAASGLIPGVGPLVAGGMGAMGAMGGGSGFQGTDKGFMGNILPTIGGALGGYGMGALGSGMGGAVQGGFSGGGGAGLLGNLGTGFKAGVNSYLGTPIIPGMPGSSGTAIGKSLGGLLGKATGQGGGATGGASGALSGNVNPATGMIEGGAKTSGVGGNWGIKDLMNPLMALGGLGITAIGQMQTTPPSPSLGETASKWLTPETITKSGAIAKDILNDQYLGDFKVTPELQGIIEQQTGDITKAYKVRATSLDTMGQAANPNWRNSGERLEMQRRLENEKQDTIQKMTADWMITAQKEHAVTQYYSVMQALGADNALKQQLLYADVYDVMNQYGIDQESVMEFRKIANQAGMYMFETGLKGMNLPGIGG